MGVFKEEAHMFETVAKKQKRIFNDAADYGYPYNTSNPHWDIKNLIDAVKGLQALDKKFPRERNLVRNREAWEGGVSLDVIIFWEEDEGYYRGTKYSISFIKTKRMTTRIDKNCDAFISVDVRPYSEIA